MNPAEINLDCITAFLGGIVLSFTPCVYPLIPVTVGFIATSSGGARLKAFILSLLYVNGLSLGYSILGLLAALTGKIFGFLSLHPFTYILAGTLIVLFGLWVLEIIRFNYSLKLKFTLQRKRPLFASFLLGFTNSFLISPCITPVLGAIMSYISAKQNLFYGAVLLFIFGYGLGFILLLSGTFSSILFYLPKSGKWMVYVKKLLGLLILFSGFYFLYLGIQRLR
ncbi:MAG: sulfite exporter TauE/SafE family protein [Candidatus Omnitrophica bacterium]|nr:sulfite exporter TauE/SafE family protein [Candidatus Omnitrophota bacterium]